MFAEDHMMKESDGSLSSVDTSFIYSGHLEGELLTTFSHSSQARDCLSFLSFFLFFCVYVFFFGGGTFTTQAWELSEFRDFQRLGSQFSGIYKILKKKQTLTPNLLFHNYTL